MTYTYDALDRLTRVVRGGATTDITYDPAGRKLSLDDPDMGDWSYAYDALGNLTRQRDAKDQRTCLYYDSLNRLTGKHYRTDDTCPANHPANYHVSYTYDAYDPTINQYGRGSRTGMTDASGSTAWRYDTRGRLAKQINTVTGSGTFVTQWTYNSADLVKTMVYPGGNASQSGETVTSTYHPQLLVNQVSGSSVYVSNTQYDAAGRASLRKLEDGSLQTAYTYSPWTSQGGRLKWLISGVSADTDSLQKFEYAYDAVGNVAQIKDHNAGGTQTQDFAYDALNRLTQAQASDVGDDSEYALENYTYDSQGRLKTKPGLGTYDYTDDAHIHAVTKINGVQKYWYDANGNLTTRVSGLGTFNLTYDAENRLTGVSGPTNATFVYDGDGKRVKGTVGTTTTVYIGDYYEWTGTTGVKYYYAGGQRVAVRTQVNNNLYYLLGDHLGSTSVVANSSGTKQSETRYKPWGEDRHNSGTPPTTFKYTGQRREAALEIYFYQSRWYDGALGRFLSPDTIIPDQYYSVDWDRYSYARNNPLLYTDPSGHCPQPGQGTGNVICIDLFIQSATIGAGFGFGDNRSFDYNSDSAASRAYAYLYLDDDGNLLSTDVTVNETCTAIGCFGPYDQYNEFSVQQNPETGEINVSWNLLNGFSGTLLNHSEGAYEEEASIGAMPLYSTAVGIASRGLAAINGEMTISVSGTSYAITSLNRDPYPSLEVYQYRDGEYVSRIWQSSERYGPFIGLSPIAPNERYLEAR